MIGGNNLNDVWSPAHLPYRTTDSPSLSTERRIAAKRHEKGPNLLYFDGHAAWKNARRLTVEDFRERKF